MRKFLVLVKRLTPIHEAVPVRVDEANVHNILFVIHSCPSQTTARIRVVVW